VKTEFALFIVLVFFASAGSLPGQVFDLPPAVPMNVMRPLDPDTRMLQRNASQLEMRGEYERALELYLELFSRYPEYNPFYDGAVRCFFAAGKLDEGYTWVDSLKSVLLKSAEPVDLTAVEKERLGSLIVDKGRFIGKKGSREEALQCWEEIYTVPGLSSASFYRLFNAYLDIRYPDGLDDMVEEARRATGNPTLLASAMARFAADRGQIDQAVDEWLRLMQFQPRQSESIKRSILGLPEDQSTRNQVESALKSALSRSEIKAEVTELLASFYFRNRQWEEAYKYVKKADRLSGGQGLSMLNFAENLTTEEQFDLALKVLNDLGKTHPDLSRSPSALLCRARTLEGKGDYSPADSIYGLLTESDFLETNEAQQALLLQARLRLGKMNDPEAARDLLEGARNRLPRLRNSGDIILLIGDTYLAQKHLEKARQTYLQAAGRNFARQPEIRSKALINAAQVDFYAGKFSQAVEKLKEASQQNPDGKLTNNALDLLQLISDDASDSTRLLFFARAELENRLKNYADAESLYVRITRETGIDDLAERCYLKLAQLRRLNDRYEDAAAALEEALQRFPGSLRAPENLLQLGDLYRTVLGDSLKAKEIYERILVDYPKSLQVDAARRRLRQLEQPET
jgi:tetratricopeptide (TPR) repeat protein